MEKPSITQQVTFLHTDDLEKTAHFYENILGLKQVLDQGVCLIYQVGSDAFIGFCESVGSRLGTDGTADPVIITLVSAEVDQWYAYLSTHDVLIEKKPTLNEKFNIYHLFLRDPNHYLVEIQTFLDPAWPKPIQIK